MKLFRTHQQLEALKKEHAALLQSTVTRLEPGYVYVINVPEPADGHVKEQLNRLLKKHFPDGRTGVVLASGGSIQIVTAEVQKNESVK